MVEDASGLSARIERARLSAKISMASLVVAAILSIVALVGGPLKGWAGLDVFTIAVLPLSLALLFSVAAFLRAGFLAKALLEEEEKRLLEKRKASHGSIMDVSEDVRFTAGRALRNYETYAPWTLALLGALATFGFLFLCWSAWTAGLRVAPVPANPMQSAVLSAILALAALFTGAFLVGQSKVPEFRWSRPVGAWLIAAFAVLSLAALNALALSEPVALKFGNARGLDAILASVSGVLLLVLGVEFLINFIMEFYRPRTQLEDRPVYESRLLALFTEPGGVIRNVADTLDYQFGFKVSKTWLYDVLQKSLLPGVLLWLLALWLFTGVVDVPPGSVGLRERFGALVEAKAPLVAGVHFKLPWPFEKISLVPVQRVQEVVIGVDLSSPENKKAAPQVVLWTSSHYKEDSFLVANESSSAADRDVANAVSVLVAFIPVNYQVKADAVADYAFKFKNVPDFLRDIGQRAATRYFASADFIKTMSSEREHVAKDLQKIIQAEADGLGLGVDIVGVNLHDVHPPVEEVAPAFQDVLCALEQKEVSVLDADAYKIRTIDAAKVESLNIKATADSYKYNRITVSSAEAERFTRQLSAYEAMPFMFKLRSYLDFLENDCKDIRKYVVPASMPYQIYELNMEEKARLDLLDANLGDLSK